MNEYYEYVINQSIISLISACLHRPIPADKSGLFLSWPWPLIDLFRPFPEIA